MKKLILFTFAAFWLLAFNTSPTVAVTPTKTASLAEMYQVAPTSSSTVTSRLSEIRMMDFSALSSAERKNLRKELRSMRSQLNAIGGTVYISVGALVLILILLILLL